jgi:hypothetical protein
LRDLTEFLFHPSRVSRVLDVLPALRASLPPETVEGRVATFPGWRKTGREIYRLLANIHYRHLRDALRAVENVLQSDCDFADLVATTKNDQFSANLSEVLVADHFLRRDFAVSKLPRTDRRTADLVVEKGHLTATIEVYSPRVWKALEDWTLAIQDAIKNLDEPYDYVVELDIRASHGLDPWRIARALDQSAQPVVEAATAELAAALIAGNLEFHRIYQHCSSGLETEIRLREMQGSRAGPARFLIHGRPAISGYAPEAMFDRLVHRNVLRRKAGKRQTQTATTRLRGMIVDLARTQIGHDLRHPIYRKKAEDILRPVDPSGVGLDFIAFCGPNALRRGIVTDFVVYDDKELSKADVSELLRQP